MEEDHNANAAQQFNNFAVNELYRICYKALSKDNQRGPDYDLVMQCHSKLSQSFRIVFPQVAKSTEEK